MYKNRVLLTFIVILFIGSLLGFFLLNMNVGDFKLSDYQSFVNDYPSDKTVEKIDNAAVAKVQAEKVWILTYGEDVKEEKPYKVSYDSTSKVWLVTGSLPMFSLGGVAKILIQTDGKVLAVWHEK